MKTKKKKGEREREKKGQIFASLPCVSGTYEILISLRLLRTGSTSFSRGKLSVSKGHLCVLRRGKIIVAARYIRLPVFFRRFFPPKYTHRVQTVIVIFFATFPTVSTNSAFNYRNRQKSPRICFRHDGRFSPIVFQSNFWTTKFYYRMARNFTGS